MEGKYVLIFGFATRTGADIICIDFTAFRTFPGTVFSYIRRLMWDRNR